LAGPVIARLLDAIYKFAARAAHCIARIAHFDQHRGPQD